MIENDQRRRCRRREHACEKYICIVTFFCEGLTSTSAAALSIFIIHSHSLARLSVPAAGTTVTVAQAGSAGCGGGGCSSGDSLLVHLE
eukprot:SAG31_NODE_4748_length_2982_cov_1.601110_5_plen_88_part_00